MTNRSLDHLFPRFHLRPATGWVNDPNGPIYYEGRYHLYYQYRPSTAASAPVFWGHASSTDLAFWRQHRAAIAPHPGGLDEDGVWSGNTVSAEAGSIRAFYSGMRRGHPFQSVVTAESTDGGASFGIPRLAVPDPAPSERVAHLRDPFVWSEDGIWWMAVGAGFEDGRASVLLHRSVDLERWEAATTLVVNAIREDDASHEPMWECPQVLDLDDGRFVIVSAWKPQGGFGPVLALTGDRGAEHIPNPRVSRVDEGPDFYAASVLRSGPDGPVVWGWIPEARDEEWYASDDWAGMVSLPRSPFTDADGVLCFRPLAALTRLRAGRGARFDAAAASVPATFEVEAEVRGRTVIELCTAGGERIEIVADPDAGTVTIDRSEASLDPRANPSVIEVADPELAGSMRLFVDGSVLELFTASGRVATARVYPTSAPPWQLSAVVAPGASARWWPIRSLQAD